MRYSYIYLCIAFALFSSFKDLKPCEYAGSNIDYVKNETQKAISEDDINLSKYHTYKAIRAIENNKGKLNSCGCDYAANRMEDSFKDLVLSTKAKTLRSARILLNRSLENTLASIEALEKHELHNSSYASDILSINTLEVNSLNKSKASPKGIYLQRKIDSSLIEYENSLTNIIENVNCKEALKYATEIYEHCEKQLLISTLSEGKKYYNFRTKQITAQALEQLNHCK